MRVHHESQAVIGARSQRSVVRPDTQPPQILTLCIALLSGPFTGLFLWSVPDKSYSNLRLSIFNWNWRLPR